MSDALTAKLRALSDPRACQDNEFGTSAACADALAEIEALRARMEELEAALGWAIGWVAEEIEPCRRRNEGCPWDEDHDRLDDARALLAAVERTP